MIGTDALSDDLLAEVRRRYGLNGRVAARRLTGGFANDVFRLDGDGAPTVLHVKHPPADADSIDWEHRVLAMVSDHLPVALPPVAALDGSTWFWHRGRPVWLVPLAPGARLGLPTVGPSPHSWADCIPAPCSCPLVRGTTGY